MPQHKKKIIFSSYDDIDNPYYAGGGAQTIHEIAKRLSHEFDITVITGSYRGAKDIKRGNVIYKRIGLSFVGPRLGQLLFHVLLPFSIMNETFDIWIESFTPPFSTSFLQLFTAKPVIGLVHMLAGEDMERKYKLPFRLIEREGLKTYRYFIVLTESFKKKIEKVNKKATFFLIPNGIDLVKPYDEQKNKQNYILYIGRLEFDQKGLDLLIDAFNFGLAKTDKKLIIAGNGLASDVRRIEKKIKEYGLLEKITLVGRVDGDRKDELLKNCSAVVVSSRFETFGTVALEAMAYAKPLISFAIEGLDWVPEDCIVRVKPFDSRLLGEAMNNVLNDAKLREKMSAAALKAVNQYSWDKIVEQYRDVLIKI